jgi:hypothetical protein
MILFGQDQSIITNVRDLALVKPTYTDSWEPMGRGLKVFRSGDDPTIYQKVFFDQKHKFQYPPTSLLIMDVLNRLLPQSGAVQILLNWISWFSVLGTILFSVLIFRDGLRKFVPEEYERYKWVFDILVIIFGLTFFPLLRGFFLGQIQTWLNFLFSMSLWFWMHKQEGKSGVCLGLISVIKPQMGLFVVWGFLRKHIKFCISLCGVAFTALLISIWRYGLPAHLKYLEVLSYIGKRGETYYPNQSINGLLNRLLFNGNNLDWEAFKFAPQNDIVQMATLISSILFIGWISFFLRKIQETDNGLGFATAGLVFTLASPVAWEHHYAILLPIFALLFPRLWALRDKWRGGIFWLCLSYVLVSNFFSIVQATAATYWNFLQSYMFFGGLILLGVLIKLQLLEKKIQETA